MPKFVRDFRVLGNFKKQEFTTKPLKLLRGYKDGIALVGVPYYTTKPDLGDHSVNYTTGLDASVRYTVTYCSGGYLQRCDLIIGIGVIETFKEPIIGRKFD